MRWILRIIGILVVAVLAGVAALLFLPGEKIAQIAADQVRSYTGRELVLSGDVNLTFWPVLGVETGPVSLSNADWASPEPMLTADSLSIGVGAAELLRGEIRVRRILADTPVLRLETGPDGRANWQFGTSAPAETISTETGSSTAPAFTLERLAFTDATLIYLSHDAAPLRLGNVDVSLNWPDHAGPADLRATLRPAGSPVELVARVDRFAAFLDGAIAPLNAQIHAPGGEIGFSGRASSAGEAAGRLDIGTKDSARLLAALGLGAVDIPPGLGRAADVSGDLTFTRDGRLSMRDLTMQLDGNRLTGAADLSMAARPRFTVQLSTGVLDLSALTEGQPAGESGTATTDGWPRTAIDASALGLADGSLSLAAESIVIDGTRIAPARVQLTLDRARGVLDLVEVGAWGGRLGGQLVANNRSGLSVGGDITVAGLELQRALTELAGIDRLSGPVTGRLKFLGVGQSMDAIMRSLKGEGAMEVGRGVISGFDLDRLMRSGQGTGGTTVFDSLTATFTIENGDMRNDDLVLSLPVIGARGQGRIGLGTQDIDYLFTPGLRREGTEEVLEIPVRISGPWAAPKIRPDLTAAAKARAQEELDALEENARQKATEKVRDELGVTVEEGQDPEEAVKDALEDKAKRRLFELLEQE